MTNSFYDQWTVKKIGVIGPGIVGMPMAAMLAHARIEIGTGAPARVQVLQRNSENSGWKVNAINQGRSVIGGIEPELDDIVHRAVKENLLSATHYVDDFYDADVVLVCVQTDKKGLVPDYGPMMEALHGLAKALQRRPEGKVPLIIFESTLAPSTMLTVFRDHFAEYGLEEGKDILLGNSPNRVMPGRLVDRVRSSDKIVGGIDAVTPRLISRLYGHIVTGGKLYETNSLTAEIVKTLENAYRDVRIAFSTEVVRYCDKYNIDFYSLRNSVNRLLMQEDSASTDSNAVPRGGILVPLVGVGGHCLPKDGILLLWRMMEQGLDVSQSLILKSRQINDDSPEAAIRMCEARWGTLSGHSVAVMGAAYRFNSEDTRNSPSLVLAKLLKERGCDVVIHDPFVKRDDQNLKRLNLTQYFTNDLTEALKDAEYLFFSTGHRMYRETIEQMITLAPVSKGVFDGANLYLTSELERMKRQYVGIGRGKTLPEEGFIQHILKSFEAMEKGMANEVHELVRFFNGKYASNDDYNKVSFQMVQQLAHTCGTGCEIKSYGEVKAPGKWGGFKSGLVDCAVLVGNMLYKSEVSL